MLIDIYISGGILDPLRIGQFTATSTDPNNNVPLESDELTVDYFYREFSAEGAPAAEARTDVEEDVTDAFIGFSGITLKQVMNGHLGVKTMYEYQTFDMTFTDKMWDYFAGVGATDANGNLLRGSYNAWASSYNPAMHLIKHFELQHIMVFQEIQFADGKINLVELMFLMG